MIVLGARCEFFAAAKNSRGSRPPFLVLPLVVVRQAESNESIFPSSTSQQVESVSCDCKENKKV